MGDDPRTDPCGDTIDRPGVTTRNHRSKAEALKSDSSYRLVKSGRDEVGHPRVPTSLTTACLERITATVEWRCSILKPHQQRMTKSSTSSYLDIAPLYGSNQEMQDSVRTFKNGILEPDTFADKRLHGMPPASPCRGQPPRKPSPPGRGQVAQKGSALHPGRGEPPREPPPPGH